MLRKYFNKIWYYISLFYKKCLLSLLDFICRWGSALFGSIVIISSAFIEIEASTLVKDNENLLLSYITTNADKYKLDALVYSAIALTILNILKIIFVNKSYSKLWKQLTIEQQKNEVIAENIKNLFEGYLFQLSKRLGFGKGRENTERATIYVHNSNGSFVPFGRFSANPYYSGPGDRTQYPDTEGCIAEGWKHGWYFKSNTSNKRFGISKRVFQKIRMRSKTFAVMRIAFEGKPLAVIVIESIEVDAFDENEVKNILEAEEGTLSELIKKLQDHIPQIGYAKERGF